jgi:hypothetical protein
MNGSFMTMNCFPPRAVEESTEAPVKVAAIIEATAAGCDGTFATLAEAQASAVACGCDPKLSHFMNGSYMTMGCPLPVEVAAPTMSVEAMAAAKARREVAAAAARAAFANMGMRTTVPAP